MHSLALRTCISATSRVAIGCSVVLLLASIEICVLQSFGKSCLMYKFVAQASVLICYVSL